MTLKARKKRNMNYINYSVERIRLEIKRLYENKKVKKIDIYETAGVSRPYLDGIINDKSDIDIRILLAINELLEKKINWFDLSEEGISNSELEKENNQEEEPELVDMEITEKSEMLLALKMIVGELKAMRKDVDDLKQTTND